MSAQRPDHDWPATECVGFTECRCDRCRADKRARIAVETAPRRQWFDVAGTCTDCDHAACFDCLGSGAHHCACEYDSAGRRVK